MQLLNFSYQHFNCYPLHLSEGTEKASAVASLILCLCRPGHYCARCYGPHPDGPFPYICD